MVSKELLCHEMHFYDVFCRRFSVSIKEYIFHLSNRKTYQFLAFAIILLFAVDPTGYRGILPTWQTFLIWIIALFVFMGACCAIVICYIWLGQRAPNLRIFSWVISLGGFFPAKWVSEAIAVSLSNGLYDEVSPIQTAFLALAVVMLEAIYFRYVMPHNASQMDGETPPLQVPDESPFNPQKSVMIGQRKVRLEVLQYITSEEHYLRVTLRHDTFVQRAKLSDFVELTTSKDGFQPHRSWWISINARPKIERLKGKPVLRLSDGTTAPIARGRIKETQDWIDRRANWDAKT